MKNNININENLKKMLSYPNNNYYNIEDTIQNKEDKIYKDIMSSNISLSENFRRIDYDMAYLNDKIEQINFNNTYFSLELWNIKKFLNVEPTNFGRDWYTSLYKQLDDNDGDINKTSRAEASKAKGGVNCLDYFKKEKTFQIPLIIIYSKDFSNVKLNGEYQLFEGHSRLAWLHYFANNYNSNIINEYHYVWVLRKKR